MQRLRAHDAIDVEGERIEGAEGVDAVAVDRSGARTVRA
jgi:hypothetical protein